MSKQEITRDVMMFKIDASQCDLRVGDRVTAGTIIGKDWETGETLQAGVEGHVEAVSFSGADHALIVLIRLSE